MAGPTDVLTEDVKELREANRQLAAEIKDVFERLSSEMRESNNRLAAGLRESNLRLAEAINGVAKDLGSLRVEVAAELRESNLRLVEAINGIAKDLGSLRVEVAKDFGAVNASLEAFRARTETSFKVAVWGVTLAVGTILAGVGSAVGITWYAAKLDSRVEQVERRVEETISAAERPGAVKR